MVVEDEEYKNVFLDKIPALRPAFEKEGTITAANASTLNDGASALILVSEEAVEKYGLKPIAKIVSYADAAQEPEWFTTAPSLAIPKALKMAGLKQSDIDLIELNEAFASQSLAVIRETGLNPDIVNVNGGAIALGHPLGCTGAKLTIQLLDEMQRRKQRYGMVTACVGGGQGIAGIFERL